MKPLSSSEVQTTEPRRGFLVTCISGLMGLISAALALPAGAYLLGGSSRKKEAAWVAAGDLEKLVAKAPEQVVFERARKDGWRTVTEKSTAWLVKTGEREVTAFSPVCTHLGCAVSWVEADKTFLCPCHTSTFGTDGKVTEGPAPRPLDQYAVKIDGNTILLGDILPAKNA